MTIWKFLIEFFVEYDCSLPCDKDVTFSRQLRRLGTKAGEFALRKYLSESDSPFYKYCFEDRFIVHNVWIDDPVQGHALYDETVQIKRIVDTIKGVVSSEDRVVIHIWGHADEEGVGCTRYDTLFDYLSSIECSHLYVNLMNSCNTFGARPFGNEKVTIWYSKDTVDDTSQSGFEPWDIKPEEYTLPDDWDHSFDIPFLIYDCWDEKTSKYIFGSFLEKAFRINRKVASILDSTE